MNNREAPFAGGGGGERSLLFFSFDLLVVFFFVFIEFSLGADSGLSSLLHY